MNTSNERALTSNMGRAWPVAIMVVLCGICMPFNMGKAMFLGPVVMSVYGIGEAMLGLMIAVFYLLGAVVAFPAAYFMTGLAIAVFLQVLTTGITAMLWTATTEVVPSKLIPGATAALAFAQNVGMLIGSMCMGGVIQALGYQMASWCVVVPCWILSIVVTWAVLRKKLR